MTRITAPSSPPRLAIVAADTAEALAAQARLVARWGQHSPAEADAIVALGGDGFLLETLHRCVERGRPIFGMNCGSVGFLLNDFHEEDLPERVAAARTADFDIFARNIAIAGGLLMLIGMGSGRFAMDKPGGGEKPPAAAPKRR